MKSSLLCALMTILLFPAMSLAGRQPAVVSKNKKTALESLAAKKNLGSFMTVVQLWSPTSDSAYIQSQLKQLNMKRATKMGVKVTGKNSFSVSGLGNFEVRRNGKELIHKGQVFRLNSNASLQKNVETITNQLSPSKVSSLVFPSAHAADPTEVQILRQRGLWVGSAVAYLSMYDQQDKTIDELANHPGVAGMLGFDPPMEIGDVNCDKRTNPDGSKETYEVDIKFRNGKEFHITQGQDSIYTFTDYEGKTYPNEDIYYKSLFNDLSGSYCSFTDDSAGRALKQAVILKANGVIHQLALETQQGGGTANGSPNSQQIR